jgi:hypothetical protein
VTAAELLPSIADLESAESRLKTGFREVAAALLDIKNRELFRAAGFASFSAYVANRLGMEKAHAYRMVEAGELVMALPPESPIGRLLTSERQVRPLMGMPVARKVPVLIAAAKEAERQKMPLTGKRVEDVARKFGWKPRAEWKRDQAEKEGAADPDESRRILFKQLIDRLEWLATFQHRPEKAVEEFAVFGGPRDWPGFVEALEFLAQLSELGAE